MSQDLIERLIEYFTERAESESFPDGTFTTNIEMKFLVELEELNDPDR